MVIIFIRTMKIGNNNTTRYMDKNNGTKDINKSKFSNSNSNGNHNRGFNNRKDDNKDNGSDKEN